MIRILELIVVAYFAVALTVLAVPVGIVYAALWIADTLDGMWKAWRSS